MGMGHDRLGLAPDPQATVVCADGDQLPGIDVSQWQGPIDWDAVATAGVVFAYVRASDGLLHPDTAFDDNWAGARAAGIHTGVYQFFEPDQDPIEQADLLLSRMGPLGVDDLPPALDVEVTNGLEPAAVATAITAWLEHVEAEAGVTPIIYTRSDFWQSSVAADLGDHPLWAASWVDGCPDLADTWTDWVFHQYTDAGSIPGISGAVDLDRFNGDLAELLTYGATPDCGDGVCVSGEDPIVCPSDCPPCGIVAASGGTIDDGDACYQLGGPAQSWHHEMVGEGGDLAWTIATDAVEPSAFVEVDLVFAEAGTYRIEAAITPAFATTKMARYRIHHGGVDDEVVVDQSIADGWLELGEFAFAAGAGSWIRLDDDTGENASLGARICADAIRLTRIESGGDTSSGGETSGAGDTSGGSESTSGGDGSTSTTGASTGGSGSTGGPAMDDGSGGCGCQSTRHTAPFAWLLALVGLTRRRRGPATTRRSRLPYAS